MQYKHVLFGQRILALRMLFFYMQMREIFPKGEAGTLNFETEVGGIFPGSLPCPVWHLLYFAFYCL